MIDRSQQRQGSAVAKLQRRSIESADEVRTIPRGVIRLFEMADGVVGLSSFEPGWRWSETVKPLAGTEFCEFYHVGYSLSGHVHVVTREGAEIDVYPGQFFEIPPHHDAWVVGDEPWISVDWGPTASYGRPAGSGGRRTIATLLFTDIVDSTARARAVGDARWRDLLGRHNGLVRAHLDRYGGHEVKTTGDGFLVRFDGAESAARCALAIAAAMPAVELQIRAGIHTGEVELQGEDVRGLAVHVAARVVALAGPGEVLVSWTTRDLLAESGLEFEGRGSHELKGLPEPRPVYALRSDR